MLKKALLISASLAVFAAAPVHAATVFTTTWEADQVPDGPTYGNYKIYNNPPTTSVAGWTPETQIELQNHAAGSPAANGGQVFAELDADFNSSMSRAIGRGTYDLSFLYSPRPGNSFSSNDIIVTLEDRTGELVHISLDGTAGGETAWSLINSQRFTISGTGTRLRFSAGGTSDSLGGYIDNITLNSIAVPEPTTWALFILGFGAIGSTLRRRNANVRVAKASLNFA